MSAHDEPFITRPATPGLHLTRPAAPAYQPVDSDARESPSRLASLDLTNTRDPYDPYDTWTELRELP